MSSSLTALDIPQTEEIQRTNGPRPWKWHKNRWQIDPDPGKSIQTIDKCRQNPRKSKNIVEDKCTQALETDKDKCTQSGTYQQTEMN